MSGSARGHGPGCPSSPPESESSRSAAGCRRAAALLFLPLLTLSFLSLAPQASSAEEVQTNCPGPRTGDKKADPDEWPFKGSPLTYELDNIYGVGCLDVMVSEAYKVSATKASEDSSKHYAFRVTSKIAPGPWGLPHRQYFEYKVKLGGTAKKGEDYEFFKSGASSHLPAVSNFLFDSSKTWVLPDTPPGFVTAAFVFRILDDDEVEPDETVTFTISYLKPIRGGQAEYQIGTATATFTIQNDDVPPTPQRPRISIAPKTSSITEGGSASFTLTATPAPAAQVQVGVTVATSGDYGITAGKRTVTIPTTGSYELTLATTDDEADELDGSVTATLNAGAGYTVDKKASSGKVAIADDDAPPEPEVTIAAGTSPVTEGGAASFTLTATPAPAADLAVSVTVATAGDYGVTAGTRTVTIPTTGSATLTLTTAGDATDEADGSVTVTVTDGDGYTVGSSASGTVAIADDDAPPEPEVTIAAGTSPVTEGGAASFTLTATPAPAADLAVSVTVATAGDYGVTAGTRTVTIPTTGSATLTLTTAGDATDEADGSVTVTVTDGDGYTVGSSASGTVAIADDDAPPEPAVTIAAGTSPVTEGGAASFTLTATPAPAANLAVSVTVATAGDYGVTAGTRTVTIPTTGSATLTLTTAGDATDEADGSVTVTVTDGDGYTVGSSASGTVSIQDDDVAPEPEVTIAAGTSPVTEGDAASFTLTATPAPAANLAVSVTVATAGDYGVTAGTRTVTIPTTGSATLTLTTAGDATDEADGSVTVTVTDGDGYTIGDPASGSITVQDDDAPTQQTVTVDPALIAQVRGYAAETWQDRPGNPHTERWKRVLVAFGVESYPGLTPMTAAEAQGYADRGWSRWDPVVTALEALEGDTPPDPPAVSITAGADITEGGDAVFTLTATPAPASDLQVSVTVATDGDWGVTTGTQSVTIPTTGSATLTLATTDDATDEADGSVTATVTDGSGYTAGDPASGTVAVQDDDGAPQPEVTISAGSAVTEGGSATFTLTATPAPAAALAVSVSVTADGDYGISAGTRTVTIPTTGSATLTLATTDDATDEADGSVTATVAAGTGYTVGDPASGSIAVRDDDEPVVVTVSAGAAVTEGGNAVFTLTASPAPAAPLAVSVTVAIAGDYGVTAGKRTVSIPTTGSYTLTLATADDAMDEPDGSVSVTVEDGTGYTVGTSASGTVAIRDDDLPPPAVTIAAKAASVTEGGDAVFTLSADRAPDADLTVRLAVSETGTGDHVAAADEGPATAVIAKGETEASFTVATVNDATDEPDGSAVVTVQAGAGYTVGDPASGTVTVRDDDITVLPSLSVADETARESIDWLLTFTVRLSAPSAQAVEVRVDTRPSTPVSAEPGSDYYPKPVRGHRLVFRAGETEKPVKVLVFDDSHDEEAETFELVLSEAKGADIGDGVAVGTIVNDDPMPAAWLARFGRTVAEHALDGIAGRMAAPHTPGMQGALAGQAVNFNPAASGQPAAGGVTPGTAPANREATLAMAEIARGFGSDAGGPGHGPGHDVTGFGASPSLRLGPGPRSGVARTMTAREALLGSSFSLTGQKDGSGGSMAFWGRASQGSFDGREGTFSLDGTVTTGMLGADYARGRWLVGLALAQSEGEGDYRDTDIMPRPPPQFCQPDDDGETPALCNGAVRAGDGKVEASLTAAIPYGVLKVSERLKLWGAAGYGAGGVTLKTEMGESLSADTAWTMAAAGMRGEARRAPAEGSGPALTVTSDALWARTSSKKTRDLAASDSAVTRVRLGLEGSYRVALEDGGTPGSGSGASLVPWLELGARHDGGDAETGFGVELGGGVKWTDPGMGLSLDLSGRTLLAHGDDDLKDRGFSAGLAYDPAPATKRGPSLNLRQEFGGQSKGGLGALFRPDPLDDRTGSEATSRWAVEAAYGLPAFGGRFTGSPHVGLGLATAARDYSVGWQLAPEAANAPDLSFGVKATRRESDAAEAEHTVRVEVQARW